MHSNNFLKDSLIEDILHLFAVLSLEDNVVSDEEIKYVNTFFSIQYPQDFCAELMVRYHKLIEELNKKKINKNYLITLLKEFNKRLTFEDKVFLIIKAIELFIADQMHEKERKAVETIRKIFQLAPSDVELILDILQGTETIEEKRSENIRYVSLGNNEKKHDVFISNCESDIYILEIQKTLFIFHKNENCPINNGPYKINAGYTSKINRDLDIIINQNIVIDLADIRYFLNHVSGKLERFYFIIASENDHSLQETYSENALAKITLKKARLYIEPTGKADIILNNKCIKSVTSFNFWDTTIIGQLPVNFRNLLYFHHENLRNVLSLEGKNEISIGNLFRNDIIVEDEDKPWECKIYLKNNVWHFRNTDYQGDIYKNEKLQSPDFSFQPNDKIVLQNSILFYNPNNNSIEHHNSQISHYSVKDINYKIKNSNAGVTTITFSAYCGQMIGIMGPSGCGKTTLLNILNGNTIPDSGEIKIDNIDFFQNCKNFRSQIGYVPQDDLLMENLTVYENLFYSASLRYPDGKKDLNILVNNVLNEIGLYSKRNTKVGDILNKKLSGGERKRLNIGLELLSGCKILFLDEPTSGLSSKDSERIMQLLSRVARSGAIVFVVIHQPGNKIFNLFDKILLLDIGGKMAFCGSPFSSKAYFQKYTHRENDLNETIGNTADFILEILEQPILDLDGKPLNVRKHLPEFWKKEFESHIIKERHEETILENSLFVSFTKKTSLKRGLNHFHTLLLRNFFNKIRDKINLLITFLVAPLLGFSIGLILKYSPNGEYNFYSNEHIGTFFFIIVLIASFLGITSSIEDIIKDQNILLREKSLNYSKISYLSAKLITIVPFIFIQNFILVLIGMIILKGKEFLLTYSIVLTVVSFTSVSIGLFISSIPKVTSKAALNLIPLVLVPQIVFGGGLIVYEKMNKQLIYSRNSPIPEICQLMPSRWGFEAIISYQSTENLFIKKTGPINNRLLEIKSQISDIDNSKKPDYTLENELLSIKDSLESSIEKAENSFKLSYGNSAIENATDQDTKPFKNYFEGKTNFYPMFITEKKLPFMDLEIKTIYYNIIILLLYSFLFNIFTILTLKWRF